MAAGALAPALAASTPGLVRQPRGLPPRILAILRARPGHVLNDYRVGDALVSAGVPDSLDRRVDLWIAAGRFPRLADFEAWFAPWPELAAWLRRHHVRWILWRADSPGNHEIAGRPGIAMAAAQGGWTLFAVSVLR